MLVIKALEAFLYWCNKVWQEGRLPRILEASKPINYRWIASLKPYLFEVMEHMTTRGLTEAGNESFL